MQCISSLVPSLFIRTSQNLEHLSSDKFSRSRLVLFSSLSTRLAHAAHLGFFYKNALSNSLLLLLLLLLLLVHCGVRKRYCSGRLISSFLDVILSFVHESVHIFWQIFAKFETGIPDQICKAKFICQRKWMSSRHMCGSRVSTFWSFTQ